MMRLGCPGWSRVLRRVTLVAATSLLSEMVVVFQGEALDVRDGQLKASPTGVILRRALPAVLAGGLWTFV